MIIIKIDIGKHHCSWVCVGHLEPRRQPRPCLLAHASGRLWVATLSWTPTPGRGRDEGRWGYISGLTLPKQVGYTGLSGLLQEGKPQGISFFPASAVSLITCANIPLVKSSHMAELGTEEGTEGTAHNETSENCIIIARISHPQHTFHLHGWRQHWQWDFLNSVSFFFQRNI